MINRTQEETQEEKQSTEVRKGDIKNDIVDTGEEAPCLYFLAPIKRVTDFLVEWHQELKRNNDMERQVAERHREEGKRIMKEILRKMEEEHHLMEIALAGDRKNPYCKTFQGWNNKKDTCCPAVLLPIKHVIDCIMEWGQQMRRNAERDKQIMEYHRLQGKHIMKQLGLVKREKQMNFSIQRHLQGNVSTKAAATGKSKSR
jgi:hypothetical protein